jgi:multimeric flavodoxin WrbA
MKHIIAINAGPRNGWNTDILIREAAKGAESEGAEVEIIDLYKLDRHTGCISCFGCMLGENKGKCVCNDALKPVLDKIREADGLIIGSPIYLGELTSEFRAIYERLIFQYITYKKEPRSYSDKKMPTLVIFTSNCPEEMYANVGYDKLIERYKGTFANFFGSAEVLVSADTLQVNNYELYDWTQFDPEKKRERRETVFPAEKAKAFELGKGICG